MNRIGMAALIVALLCPCCDPCVWAGEVDAGNGLRAEWESPQITRLSLNGNALPGVSARLFLADPQTRQPVAPGRFSLEAALSAGSGALRLEGVVTATGADDAVADLILRVDGVSIPTGDGAAEPLLLAKKLLNRLPIAPLRVVAGGEDRLALAIPAERPCIYEFRDAPAEKAVELRFPFGFTHEAKPPLRMRAPFSVVLYPTEPRWHFRSALAEYYRLFPKSFERVEKRDGGWFFANQTENIPDPQHYAFHEGSGSIEEDHQRNMGMFPYSETSSETIRLKGPDLPKDYDDAMRQMDDLDSQITAADWTLAGCEVCAQEKHAGERACKCSLDKPEMTAHAQQLVTLPEPIAEPLIVSGWSKAESVSGKSNNGYSIYVDALCRDGGYLFGQCAVFRPGTHDWERTEHVIEPKSPVAEMRVYAMFRGHTGTAWFDDIRIARKSRPDENLLKNGDWELLGKRKDIQFVRDNACTDAEQRYRVRITDNYSSDVPPTEPLSLLRFTCNVDPDLRAPEGRPTPAGRTTEMYDLIFKNTPGTDGCYIDSAASWCATIINHRRDHFACADSPFTYDPKTLRVGQHGLFAAYRWLRFIQDRYHPAGKTIFGNMGPSVTGWPCYTAMDIIGIESSQFKDTALMAYHRYGGYHKPVLPMNYVNLHGLGDRATAEEFVLASAYWGHFPSTGRMVREGYESYGDVCHSYYPALIEMSRAGWEPIPWVEGVTAERFGRGEVVYLTVRADEAGRVDRLTLLPPARQGVQEPPVVMDAVQLASMPCTVTEKGLEIELAHGGRELTILRIASRRNTAAWLIERAAHHCDNAAIVRGRSENTDRLKEMAAMARRLNPAGDPGVGELVRRIETEKEKVRAEADSLEKTSATRELLDAERAVAEWVLFVAEARLAMEGARVVSAATDAKLTPKLDPGKTGARLVGSWAEEGRNILRLTEVKRPAATPSGEGAVVLRRDLPGAMHLLSAIEAPVPGVDKALTVIRAANVFFAPVVRMNVDRRMDPAKETCEYRVTVERLAGPMALKVAASAQGLSIQPAEAALGPEQSTATFSVSLSQAPPEVVELRFTAMNENGRVLVETTSHLNYAPPPPPGDLALAGLGAAVKTDSSYPHYTPAPIIDGVWETAKLPWAQKAWASSDRALPEGHWVEIALPRPVELSQIWIYWAFDNDRVWCSHSYDVEVWENGAWRQVASVRKGPERTVSRHQWAKVTTDKVRVHQLPEGGPSNRPNIMWVSEVCLYP